MNVSNYITSRQDHFNQIVDRFLPDLQKSPVDLHQAMAYAVGTGGKRIRPLLVYAAGEMMGAGLETLDRVACCVEFIHTYSLIHDDLPAMDNADFRRGKPACHKVFGEATAILAGNALQNLAFELIAEDESQTPALRLAMIKTLSQAVGSEGVLGGQMLDLKAQTTVLNADQIERIHRMKTAALMVGSVISGAFAAGCTDVEKLKKLEQMAYDFGLAFQIGDDILDKEEDALNYANQMGLKAAYERMDALYAAVFEYLSFFSKAENNPLYCVVNYIKGMFDLELKMKA